MYADTWCAEAAVLPIPENEEHEIDNVVKDAPGYWNRRSATSNNTTACSLQPVSDEAALPECSRAAMAQKSQAKENWRKFMLQAKRNNVQGFNGIKKGWNMPKNSRGIQVRKDTHFELNPSDDGK